MMLNAAAAAVMDAAVTSSRALLSRTDDWGNWMVLLGNASIAQWMSKHTLVGRLLGPPITAMGLTFVMATIGILPAGGTSAALALQAVTLHLATPLVLLGADFRCAVQRCGPLLLSFGLAAAATLIASALAWMVVGSHLTTAFGSAADALKIAAALMARNIGGGLNYMAVVSSLQASPSAIAAGLCADNIFGLLYFPTISYLAAGLPDPERAASNNKGDKQAEQSSSSSFGDSGRRNNLGTPASLKVRSSNNSRRRSGFRGSVARSQNRLFHLFSASKRQQNPSPPDDMQSFHAAVNGNNMDGAANMRPSETGATTKKVDDSITVERLTSVLFTSGILIWLGQQVGGVRLSLPACGLFAVLLINNRFTPASWVESIQPTSDVLGTAALYVFFSTLGAQGAAVADSVRASMIPLGVFLGIVYSVHGFWLWALHKLLYRKRQQNNDKGNVIQESMLPQRLLVASSASIGGPATAVALAQTNDWPSLKVPGLMVGNLGDAIGTILGIAFFAFFQHR